MHKKHKFLQKDRHGSTTRKGHVRSRKQTDESTLEIIRVPQNSRNELIKKFGTGDYEVEENCKSSNKHRHKSEREQSKSKDRHDSAKHEKLLVHNLADIQGIELDKEPVRHKEKKEKRDKERLNKIEKYLEGLNTSNNKKLYRNRSFSLESSETLLRNQEKHMRREKTFHDELKKDVSSHTRFNSFDKNNSRVTTTKPTKEGKSRKKHKHKESKERECSKEKNTRENENTVLYCEVEYQNPYLRGKKKRNIDNLYPDLSNKNKEKPLKKRSSSLDNPVPVRIEPTSTNQKELKEKKVVPVKFSSRRSKVKTDIKNYKDQRSSGSIAIHGKHFSSEKKFRKEKETVRHKKKKSKEDKVKQDKTKKNQDKISSNSDQYKAKIEDDIKSYFSRIQSLIDKKLDFILGNSNSKETKSDSVENEIEIDKAKSKKNKTHKVGKEKDVRDRSHSKRRKKSERTKSVEDAKREKHIEEDLKIRQQEEDKRASRESRRIRESVKSNSSLKRERYPSTDSRDYKHHSPHRQRHHQDQSLVSPPYDSRENDHHHHRRHKSPYHQNVEYKISPDRLIKMLEHPSTFSVPSNKGLSKEKLTDNDRGRPNEAPTHRKDKDSGQKKDRSLTRRSATPLEHDIKVEEIRQTQMYESHPGKLKKHTDHPVTLAQSNMSFVEEKIEMVKDDTQMEMNGNEHHHHTRDRSLVRKQPIPGEDDFKVEELDPVYLQEAMNKKLKKYKKRLVNLQCKTISIVGIPSQIGDSVIFHETQTTTSLNAISPKEDIIEQKKKSKRFKLYYKYSVSDNQRPHESDKSSEEKKSIVSDSLRVLSDPSDHNIDVWEEKEEPSTNVKKESEGELEKILFVMKKEERQKNCGDTTRRRSIGDHSSKKHRKRGNSPIPITLNNILEEPSNISIMLRHNETPSFLKKDLNCTFFNALKSSSSDCNFEIIKKSGQNDLNLQPHKHKDRHPGKTLKENSTRPKSSSKKSRDRDRSSEKKLNCNEKCKQIRKSGSHQKIKKKHNKDTYKYTSKSDIDVSYDSLRKCKFNKGKHKSDAPSRFREQLKHLLPEIFARKQSPERKNIGLILKEELKEIMREIPKSWICKETSVKDLKLTEPPKHGDTDIEKETKKSCEVDHKETNEESKTQVVEEKKYCTKKIGTHPATTKIPSLIKGYIATQASQVLKEDSIENEENQPAQSIMEDPNEKNLVDAATEVSIEQKLGIEEKAEITLENKKSQTPNYLNSLQAVGLGDARKQFKHSKKVTTPNNAKQCLVDPFADIKKGFTPKSTRPIINLENNQFPNRKHQEPNARPISAEFKRQKSNLSDRKSVKFQEMEKPGKNKISTKCLPRRPATADGKCRDTSKTPFDDFKTKLVKKPLTISTNVITINSSICDEEKNNKMNKQRTKGKKETQRKGRRQSSVSSKSALSLNDADLQSGIGSLVCLDRFNNAQKFNLNSQSNSRSLDRYTTVTKSIINDNPHASTLFFTKSFSPQMNTYQRRKMYDESIRRKMKKKNMTQQEMGPRVYEVRYLTLENRNLGEASNVTTNPTPIVNQKCFSKFPTFSTKTNKVKQRTKPSQKKSKRYFPKNKEDACKFSGRDIFAPIISDVDQLNKFRRKTFPEKKLEEIFFKDESGKKQDELKSSQGSSFLAKDDTFSIKEASNTNQTDPNIPDENIKVIIDNIYKSIISYCNTKFKLPHEQSHDSPKESNALQQVEERKNVTKPPPVNEKSYVVFPKSSNETVTLTREPFNKKSEESTSCEGAANRPAILVSGHLSCPVLAGSMSSFDYLYEEGSIEINKEAVMSQFKKPMKTILGYALNNTKPIQKDIHGSPKKEDQISNSATESEESGYSSNISKKCGSVCSFFKKPSIANLFKPVAKLEVGLQSINSLNESGPNLKEYKVMNQKCIEYAEKVRNQTQNKEESEETFQEIPLDLLLLCKKSSTFLSDFNSNCSLCKKHSNPDLPDIIEGDELSYETEYVLDVRNSSIFKNNNASPEGVTKEETLIFYEDFGHTPSLEIITFQNTQTNFSSDTSEPIKQLVEHPVVLSITNLNSCSLTLVEESEANSNNFYLEDKQVESGRRTESIVQMVMTSSKENCKYSNSDITSLTQTDFDGRSIASSRYTESPTSSKFMAKRFFDNLLKVYEKEIDVTNKLFRDDDFFMNVLLESVRPLDVSKTKSNVFKKLIKNKLKGMFSRSSLDSSNTVVSKNVPTTNSFSSNHQRKLQTLAGGARKYFSMFVQAVKTNKDINDEVKICGLLRLLERIEDGDFAILRKQEEVDFEEEIKEQVKEAFINIYQISIKEAKKHKRSLTTDDLKLIRTFVSKYRIGLLSKTNLIATYIGRGFFRTESDLKAAVKYLIQQNKNRDINLKEFDEHCKLLQKCI